MDARVNDFLNEINEIAPLAESEDNLWEKCLDEDSGFNYYWNTKTNEVTWDMPPDYKSSGKTKPKKSMNLYMPPRTAPLFPSASHIPPVADAIKIYKIGECSDKLSSTSSYNVPTTSSASGGAAKKARDKYENKSKPKAVKKPYPSTKSDSDEEKIVLISSYGGDSDSEEERPPTPKAKAKTINGSKPGPVEDSPLSNLQKRAKELSAKVEKTPPKQKPSSTAFSLIAGYSDSGEEDEEEEAPPQAPKAVTPEPKMGHSTLFPIPKKIDIKDFETPNPEIAQTVKTDFDAKAFQRKRRIGVALINTAPKKVGSLDENLERKGLGYSKSESAEPEKDCNKNLATSSYPGFKSGGVMFVKSDTLNPNNSEDSGGGNISENKQINDEKDVNKLSKDVEEGYKTLKEKLGFLTEGRPDVSPVQVMLIQLEALFLALKSGDLRQSYLRKWLEDICSDLVKLEKEATPEGWLLQWDRKHKRYYYQNEASGESQWEYPQADVTGCDDAMDICTTPPPDGAEDSIHMSPPLPPKISSPSPPPPPVIGESTKKSRKPRIPVVPNPPADSEKNGADKNKEPLPPGVDPAQEIPPKNESKGDLNDVLSSFYSDIAAMESNPSPSDPTDEVPKDENSDNPLEPAKKKKKTKVKLAQGIAMKKKGVSKLVEKWKNVQLSYNDQ